ncbi:MAG: hypothetical protein CM15mP92_1300 [Halieaceae bacterium]|nr:MAG: hypothetical protein CM15mP92_1300 [Halieaceae bacterium]
MAGAHSALASACGVTLKRGQKKPAEYQPAMKEPLKTGRISIVGPSLLRCFPCGAPVDIAISTAASVTGVSAKSSKKKRFFKVLASRPSSSDHRQS